MKLTPAQLAALEVAVDVPAALPGHEPFAAHISFGGLATGTANRRVLDRLVELGLLEQKRRYNVHSGQGVNSDTLMWIITPAGRAELAGRAVHAQAQTDANITDDTGRCDAEHEES